MLGHNMQKHNLNSMDTIQAKLKQTEKIPENQYDQNWLNKQKKHAKLAAQYLFSCYKLRK